MADRQLVHENSDEMDVSSRGSADSGPEDPSTLESQGSLAARQVSSENREVSPGMSDGTISRSPVASSSQDPDIDQHGETSSADVLVSDPQLQGASVQDCKHSDASKAGNESVVGGESFGSKSAFRAAEGTLGESSNSSEASTGRKEPHPDMDPEHQPRLSQQPLVADGSPVGDGTNSSSEASGESNGSEDKLKYMSEAQTNLLLILRKIEESLNSSPFPCKLTIYESLSSYEKPRSPEEAIELSNDLRGELKDWRIEVMEQYLPTMESLLERRFVKAFEIFISTVVQFLASIVLYLGTEKELEYELVMVSHGNFEKFKTRYLADSGLPDFEDTQAIAIVIEKLIDEHLTKVTKVDRELRMSLGYNV